MRNRTEKNWLREIKCPNLTKNLSEKSFESTSIKSSMTILHRITIFFSVVTFAEKISFFVRSRSRCLNWHDSSLTHWWCALNRGHRQILNQDCSFEQFVSSILNNLLQHDLVYDNWNRRFRQHSFIYNNRWYNEKERRAETYKSIEKRMRRIVLMYENESFCQSLEFFLLYEFFASLYNDYLHEWNMLWFLSASLKASEDYCIQFVIEKRFCQTMRSSFLTDLETSSDIWNGRCIVGI